MLIFDHECKHCGNVWISNVENPKRCNKCAKSLKYRQKYVKSSNLQRVRVSDKCYSMLLRRKKVNDEKISSVIQRIVNENKFSETVRYKEEPVIHQVSIKAELLMKIYEIANKYNIRTINEVIWRLL